MDFSDIWDYFVEGLEYFISFDWFFDFKDGIGDFFSSVPDMFTSDSPITSIWFWVFYGFFAIGIWVLPSSMGLLDYSLRDKILGSIVFFIIDFFVVGHFKST